MKCRKNIYRLCNLHLKYRLCNLYKDVFFFFTYTVHYIIILYCVKCRVISCNNVFREWSKLLIVVNEITEWKNFHTSDPDVLENLISCLEVCEFGEKRREREGERKWKTERESKILCSVVSHHKHICHNHLGLTDPEFSFSFLAIKPNLSVGVFPKACVSRFEQVERMGFLPSLIFTFRWCHLCVQAPASSAVCWQAPDINIEMKAVTQRNGAYTCLTHRRANEGYFQKPHYTTQCMERVWSLRFFLFFFFQRKAY